jgi:hypothetical protein
MEIDVKTDAGIPGREAVARVVAVEVERALEPFSNSLLRVAVRLRAERGDGPKRCTIEALARGGTPITVSQRAPGVRPAVAAAVRRLASELAPSRPRARRQAQRSSLRRRRQT